MPRTVKVSVSIRPKPNSVEDIRGYYYKLPPEAPSPGWEKEKKG